MSQEGRIVKKVLNGWRGVAGRERGYGVLSVNPTNKTPTAVCLCVFVPSLHLLDIHKSNEISDLWVCSDFGVPCPVLLGRFSHTGWDRRQQYVRDGSKTPATSARTEEESERERE